MRLECAETRDRLPEFTLGVLDGVDRSDVLAHLAVCAACRADAAEYAATADGISQLVPEAEPPVGFEGRVAARLRAERTPQRRRFSWRSVGLAAAVAAALMIATIVGVRVIDAGRSDTARPVQQAEMVGAGGTQAGRAFVTNGDAPSLVVHVDYGIPTGRYDVVATHLGGSSSTLGHIEVQDGAGVWVGEVGNQQPLTGVRLVGATGATMCAARFA
jgi:Putative zinc-finger